MGGDAQAAADHLLLTSTVTLTWVSSFSLLHAGQDMFAVRAAGLLDASPLEVMTVSVKEAE